MAQKKFITNNSENMSIGNSSKTNLSIIAKFLLFLPSLPISYWRLLGSLEKFRLYCHCGTSYSAWWLLQLMLKTNTLRKTAAGVLLKIRCTCLACLAGGVVHGWRKFGCGINQRKQNSAESIGWLSWLTCRYFSIYYFLHQAIAGLAFGGNCYLEISGKNKNF